MKIEIIKWTILLLFAVAFIQDNIDDNNIKVRVQALEEQTIKGWGNESK